MDSYYKVLDALKSHFENNSITNTVHEGDVYKVDLSKESIFPLANIDVSKVPFKEHTIQFDIKIIVADILDETKENEKDAKNVFHGANNLQDIYNTQLGVLNVLQSSLRRGELMNEDYEVLSQEELIATPFEQRFENLLVGWVLDLSIEVPNTDVSTC